MLTYRRKGRNEERPLRVKAKRYEHIRRPKFASRWRLELDESNAEG